MVVLCIQASSTVLWHKNDRGRFRESFCYESSDCIQDNHYETGSGTGSGMDYMSEVLVNNALDGSLGLYVKGKRCSTNLQGGKCVKISLYKAILVQGWIL